LEWALSRVATYPRPGRVKVGFNPCFLGMGAFTWLLRCDFLINWNVSILVFLEWALSQVRIWQCYCNDNKVSILVFLEWALSLVAWKMQDISIISFNPCFLGMGAFTLHHLFAQCFQQRVSILVFLEWALSLSLFQKSHLEALVSILVFLEWALSLFHHCEEAVSSE